MNMSVILQAASAFIAALGAFCAYRARDNRRAETLAEIRTELKYVLKRLSVIENRVCAGTCERNKKREESA